MWHVLYVLFPSVEPIATSHIQHVLYVLFPIVEPIQNRNNKKKLITNITFQNKIIQKNKMKSSWQIKIKIFLKEFKTVMFSREKKKAEAICNTKDKSKQNQQQAGVSSTLETTHARNDGENWQEHINWSVIVSYSIDRMFQGVAPDCRWDVSGVPCHVYKYHTGGVVTLISPSPPPTPHAAWQTAGVHTATPPIRDDRPGSHGARHGVLPVCDSEQQHVQNIGTDGQPDWTYSSGVHISCHIGSNH